jgi:hypothetical protein
MSPSAFIATIAAHGWIDPQKDLVGVFLMPDAAYAGNAKAVFMGMAGAAVADLPSGQLQ